MEKKKIISIIVAVCIAVLFIFCLLNKNSKSSENINTETLHNTDEYGTQNIAKDNMQEKETINKDKTLPKQASIEKNEQSTTKTIEISTELPNDKIPFSAINILYSVSPVVKQKLAKIAETNNIYMVQNTGNKLLIVTDNPANIRHGIEFTEISLSNGHQTKTTLGYNDKMQDSDNDIWEYDKDSKLPIRHTKYNLEGDMEFVEVWNYDTDNPVKYEMKDSENKIISMRKETPEGESNLRVEHLVYDKNGNTKINVSASYEGPDIKRFTYYNADKLLDSGSVFSEYSEDGLKIKETVYSSDLKVKNSYKSEYKDGIRQSLIIFDDKNKEVKKLINQKSNEENL